MKPLYPILFFFLLASCAPQALVPLQYNPNKDSDPVAIIEAENLVVYMENIERRNDLLVFDLEIANNSNRPVTIKHPELYYHADYHRFPEINDSLEIDIQTIHVKPEQVARRGRAMSQVGVEKYYEQAAKDKKALGVFLLVVGAGLIINDIVQDANDASQAIWTETDANRAVTRDAITAGSLLAIDILGHEAAKGEVRHEEDLYYVPFEMFPEEMIGPGESKRGKVFFPAWQSYKYYRFVLPIGNTDYMFDFRKRKQADRDKLHSYDRRP